VNGLIKNFFNDSASQFASFFTRETNLTEKELEELKKSSMLNFKKEKMIDFLSTSTISLLVFLGFYHLVLEREKTHRFNRFYLLFAVVISFVLPFLNFEIIKIVPVVQTIQPLTSEITSSGLPEHELQKLLLQQQKTSIILH